MKENLERIKRMLDIGLLAGVEGNAKDALKYNNPDLIESLIFQVNTIELFLTNKSDKRTWDLFRKAITTAAMATLEKDDRSDSPAMFKNELNLFEILWREYDLDILWSEGILNNEPTNRIDSRLILKTIKDYVKSNRIKAHWNLLKVTGKDYWTVKQMLTDFAHQQLLRYTKIFFTHQKDFDFASSALDDILNEMQAELKQKQAELKQAKQKEENK